MGIIINMSKEDHERWEKELAEDKCCFCLPIVCGMKVLSAIIIVSNLFEVIQLLMRWAKEPEGMTAFLIILSIGSLGLMGAIIFCMTSWFLDRTKLTLLVRGLMANVLKAIVLCVILVWQSGNAIAAARAKFDAEKADRPESFETPEDEKRYDQAVAAAE